MCDPGGEEGGCNPGGGWGAGAEYSTLNSCVVVSNRGYYGGGLLSCNVANSTVTANSASIGGGAAMSSLNNCTVVLNSASYGGGMAGGTANNCIIYSNFFYGCTNSENEWFNAGAGVFDHCCTTPDPGGVGNIILGPQFLDPTNGNFHLASNSPCIAAGVVQPWMIGAFDLDGNPRTTNGVVDMGAYQSPFAKPPPPPIILPSPVSKVWGFSSSAVRPAK